MIFTCPFVVFSPTWRVLLMLAGIAAASCSSPTPGPGDDDDDDDSGEGAGCGTAAPGPICLELLAGSLGEPGNVDGAGPAEAFDLPQRVAVDRTGNAYVAAPGNSTIRKIVITDNSAVLRARWIALLIATSVVSRMAATSATLQSRTS